jgi:hypothetical protein
MNLQFSYCFVRFANTFVLDKLQPPSESNRCNSETRTHKKGDLEVMASEKEIGFSCRATDVHV